jgi:hypothetical protein
MGDEKDRWQRLPGSDEEYIWPVRSEAEQAAEFGRELYLIKRRWSAGDFSAVADGVRLCWLRGRMPPDWLA